jgi:Arc/MetJ-type ribon-helix-helix transcriptional regulator
VLCRGIVKKPISATIEQDLIAWLERKVTKERTKYRNKSHLIEIALERMRKEDG